MMLKGRVFIISLVLGYVFLPTTVSAASYQIESMNISSGYFLAWDNNGVPIVNPSSGGTITDFTTIGVNTDLVSGYIGSGGSGLEALVPDPNSIVGAIWFDLPVNTYTANTNLGDLSTPAGTLAGGPIPSGILDDVANSMTMDLSALFVNWANVDFNVGTGKQDNVTSAFATGQWDPVTGAYTLTWDSLLDAAACGPFGPECRAQFVMQGSASPVPLPATIWLLVSGCIVLFRVRYR